MGCFNFELAGYGKLNTTLKKELGDNVAAYTNLVGVFKTKEFRDYIAENNINPKTEPRKTYDALVKISNKLQANVVNQDYIEARTKGGFSSRQARETALNYSAGVINLMYFQNSVIGNGDVTLAKLIGGLRNNIAKGVSNRYNAIISSNEEAKSLANSMTEKNDSPEFIVKTIIEKFATVQEQNFYQLYNSLTAGNNYDFINDLLLRPKVSNIVSKVDKDFEKIDDENAGNFMENADGADEYGDIAEVDTMTKLWTKNIGEVKDYNSHVEDIIKYHLNSIPMLASTEKTGNKYVYDKDNELGIVGFASAESTAKVLYASSDKSNVDNFIQSLYNIANMMPNMKHLIYLGDALKANRNLAYKYMMVFNKPVVSKLETYIDNKGAIRKRISNPNTNPEDMLNREFINDLDNNIFTDIIDEAKPIIDKLNVNPNNIALLYEVLHKIHPSVTEQSVILYVTEQPNNANRLFALIKADLNAIYRGQQNNAAHTKARAENPDIATPATFLDSGTLVSRDLANIFKDKLPIMIELNSYNVERNSSSDIINKSYFTNFIANFETDEAIAAYARRKFLSKQYEHSNILIEHRRPDGTIINRGLFAKIGNSYELTEYGKNIIKLRLFNGASDRTSGNTALYKDMSDGDYLFTALNNFDNTETDETGIPMADYFTSIPSDAPKTFSFSMPKVSIAGFYENVGETEYMDEKSTELSNIRRIDATAPNFANAINNANILIPEMFKSVVNAPIDIIVTNHQAVDVDGGRIYRAVISNGNGVYATVESKQLEVTAGNTILKNAKLLGILKTPNNPTGSLRNVADEIVSDYVKFNIRNRNITTAINRNHPIFLQFKNMVMQKITNAANALDKMFVVVDGAVQFDADNKPIYSEAYLANKAAFYDDYHLKGGEGLVVKDEVYELAGDIFKCSILKSEYANSPLINDLVGTGKAIDFLYGGSTTTNPRYVELVDGVAKLTAAQNLAVEDAVAEWLTKYANNASRNLQERYGNIIPEKFDNISIQEFLLNQYIAYKNMEDLFSGEQEFYGKSINILKRLKELQAGGSPFGNTDLAHNVSDANVKLHDVTVGGKVLTIPYTNSNGEVVNKPIQLDNGFNAVTIYNTSKPSDEAVISRIKKQLGQTNLSAKAIEVILQPFMGKTKVNDAQSWITFEEWIRRITAAGELEKYTSFINAVNSGIPAADIDWSAINNRVQVQKNYYYDLAYAPISGVEAARQIKNAELVLIPALIQGTDLERIYNLMMEKNIHQLNTIEATKAAKHNNITLWDNNGNITPKNWAAFSDNIVNASERFSYNYLYRQQEVPQHMQDTDGKVAVQITKKIIDNISLDDKGNELKAKFFRNYVANIRHSFNDICDELGIERDANNNIKLVNGEIPNVNKSVLFKKFRDNATRQSTDENMLEYFNVDEDGFNDLPLFMNIVSTKLESIANGIFNSSITRQTIAGWHAAQVSDFGFNVSGSTQRDSKLQYKQIGTQMVDGKEVPVYYSEIKLPIWDTKLRGMNINDVPDSLRTMIGYRIPTEGKQSIMVMKVVEFLSEGFGSTVVVPDEWVTQTGSDFDVDSIYAMTKKFMKAGNQLIEYTDDRYSRDRIGYERYVMDNLDRIARKNLGTYGKDVRDIAEFLRNENKAIRDQFNEDISNSIAGAYEIVQKLRTDLYIASSQEFRNALARADKFNKNVGYAEDKIDNILEMIEPFADDSRVAELIDVYNNIKVLIGEKQDKNEAFKGKFASEMEALRADVREQRNTKVADIAKAGGLKSYDDYLRSPVEDINNRATRDNNIVNTFIDILNNPVAFEENTSTSNFEVLRAMNSKWNKLVSNDNKWKTNKGNAGALDFLTQMAWQKSATSGMKLKAVSVNRDSFASICNVARAYHSKGFTTVYSKDTISHKDAVARFGADNVTKLSDGRVSIQHRNIGWSNDNKSVDGYLITPYSSQTTAHILDVMKEGAIYNENEYTFNVMKTIVDMGSDYDTAMAFMHQPAVDAIVQAWETGNSFTNDGYVRPIAEAYDTILSRTANYESKNESIADKVASFKKKAVPNTNITYGDLYNKYLNGGSIMNFDADAYAARLAMNSMSPEAIAFDIAVLEQFDHLNRLGQDINNNAMAISADKFGAKQNYYLTDKVFRDIKKIVNDSEIYVGDNLLVNAVYPNISSGINGFMNADINDSVYPTIAAFLKYATITSSKIGETVFDTADSRYLDLVYNIENYTKSGMTEKLFKDYSEYIVGKLYVGANASPYLVNPVSIYNNQLVFTADNSDNGSAAKQAELKRIAGIERTIKMTDVNIADISAPTQEEVDTFAKLTPAEKVFYIKSNFNDSGIFNYINVNFVDERDLATKGFSAFKISFKQGDINDSFKYSLFNQAYFNSNPLIRLAAIDVAKYAFVVEHNTFKANNVSKTVSNAPLRSWAEGGMNIAFLADEEMTATKGIESDSDASNEIALGFIRQNYETFPARFINVDRLVQSVPYFYNGFIVNEDGSINIDANAKDGYKYVKAGLLTNDNTTHKVVRMRIKGVSNLYMGMADNVYYPINKLEPFESDKTIEDSVVARNNKFANYYEVLSNVTDNVHDQYAVEPAVNNDLVVSETVGNGNKDKFAQKLAKSKERNFVYINPGFEAVSVKFDNAFDNKTYIANIISDDIIIQARNISEDDIKRMPKSQQDLVKYLAKYPNANTRNIYVVNPVNNDVAYSSITDKDPVGVAIKAAMGKISLEARRGNSAAMQVVSKITNAGVDYKNTLSIADNKSVSVGAVSDFIELAVNTLNDRIGKFMKVGLVDVPIDDARVMDAIKKDNNLRDYFLDTILSASTFNKQYRLFTSIDTSNLTESQKDAVDKINDSIRALNANQAVANARTMFIKNLVNETSTNPNVQAGIMDALDAYGDTSFMDKWIQDIKFNKNLLVQNVVKEVSAVIKEGDINGRLAAKDFDNFIAKAKADAAKDGKSIDFAKFITPDGKFAATYNEDLLSELNALSDAVNAAILNDGEDSMAYIKAKLAKSEFINDHIRQDLNDAVIETPEGSETINYYQSVNRLTRDMVDNFPDTFIEYRRLKNAQRDILRKAVNGVINDEQKAALDIIYDKIYSLTSPFDDSFESKANMNINSETDLNTVESAKALENYIKNTKFYKDLFFESDVKDGFEVNLKKNLDIIASFEYRVDGNLVNNMDELMKNEKYRDAKEWVKYNARYVLDADDMKDISWAFDIFKDPNKGNSAFNNIARKEGVRDVYGTIDGRNVSDEDAAIVRRETLLNYNINKRTGLPYAGLLRSNYDNNTIYTNEFYQGLKSNRLKAQEEIDIMDKINKLLDRPNVWQADIKKLRTSELSKAVLTQRMDEDNNNVGLYDLLNALGAVKGQNKSENGKAISNFIANYVDLTYNMTDYEIDVANAKRKGNDYYAAWSEIFTEVVTEEDGTEKVVPNSYFYGIMKPKDEHLERFTNKDATEAIRILNERARPAKTQYYFQALAEAKETLSPEDYKAWVQRNHVYNPYSRTFEPIRIWTTMQFVGADNKELSGKFVPKVNQMQTKPKEMFARKDYSRYRYDYKRGTGYDNAKYNEMNIHEYRVMKEMQSLIAKYSFNNENDRYIGKGYLPSMSKAKAMTASDYGKELLSLLGLTSNVPHDLSFKDDDQVDFSEDYDVPNPMLKELADSNSKKRIPVPVNPLPGEAIDEFNKRRQKAIDDNKVIDAENQAIHKSLMNNDWVNVFKAFLTQSSHYNAVRNVKNLLYLADQTLERNDAYRTHNADLSLDRRLSSDEEPEYKMVKQDNTRAQLKNYIRRVVFEQYKDAASSQKLLRFGTLMQNIAGTKFMMMNITGGLANVLTGSVNITMERFASEYLNIKDWELGKAEWLKGVTSYMTNMYSEDSTSLQDGLIKLANVINLDNIIDMPNTDALREKMRRFRGLLFSPQTIGEHYMQNTMLFSLMLSHKVVVDNQGITRVMSKDQYHRDAETKAVFAVIGDNADLKKTYNDMVQSIKDDAKAKAKYNLFRQYINDDFVKKYFNPSQQKSYIATRNKFIEESNKDFDAIPTTVYSQFELKDGIARLKPDSNLTVKEFAAFVNKVIGVNKKVHGVYDKLGGAMLEKSWYGGMVMQYHKHLYPGFKKRFRWNAYYDEELGSIEKGSYISLINYLAIPFNKAKVTNKEAKANDELTALQGIQNYMKELVNFAGSFKLNYELLPENEKANIRRNWSELLFTGMAIGSAILLLAAANDDEEESIAFNLLMYQLDRLASETAAFTPWGAYGEGKKLWSSPIAMQGTVNDMLATMSYSAKLLFSGGILDKYRTGRYSGQNKLEVLIMRNIPVVRSVNRILDLPDNNSYYKLNETMMSIVPTRDIADAISK